MGRGVGASELVDGDGEGGGNGVGEEKTCKSVRTQGRRHRAERIEHAESRDAEEEEVIRSRTMVVETTCAALKPWCTWWWVNGVR
jgi:hypothetical protein